MPEQNEPLLQVKRLTISSGKTAQVKDVNFDIWSGFSVALMGENGSGRTTIAKAIISEITPSNGEIISNDKTVMYISGDNSNSFNPAMNALEIVADPLVVNSIVSKAKVSKRVKQLFKVVSLESELLEKCHSNFNELDKFKLALARALTLRPKLIILDEPLMNIDNSQKQQILNILDSIKKRFSITLLLITNDIQAIRTLCNRAAILCAGRLVEFGSIDAVFGSVKHPYTEALLFSAVNSEKYNLRQPPLSPGAPDTIKTPPAGCPFHKRCRYAIPQCLKVLPEPQSLGNNHLARCIRYDQLKLKSLS